MSLGTNVINDTDILLGTGTIKFNGVNVGQLKGDVVFTPEAEYKEFKAGIPQQLVKTLKFSEGAKLKASFAEFNRTNLAMALNVDSSEIVTTTGTVTTETLVLTGTDAVSVVKNRNISNVVVKKGAATAVLGTDYVVVSPATGLIARVTGSTEILDGDSVTVSYTYEKTATVSFGGGAQPNNVPAEFTYLSPDNDIEIVVQFWKSKVNAGNPITFKEDDFTVNDFEIVAVSDSTKDAGKQLGQVTFNYFPE